MSKLEEKLALHIRLVKLPEPVREYRFGAIQSGGTGKGLRERLKQSGLRDWRFDFAWPEIKLAVEVEGGAHINGRHNRGSGFEDDLVKYGEAMRHGWTVYRCGSKLIKEGRAIEIIKSLIEQCEAHTIR